MDRNRRYLRIAAEEFDHPGPHRLAFAVFHEVDPHLDRPQLCECLPRIRGFNKLPSKLPDHFLHHGVLASLVVGRPALAHFGAGVGHRSALDFVQAQDLAEFLGHAGRALMRKGDDLGP